MFIVTCLHPHCLDLRLAPCGSSTTRSRDTVTLSVALLPSAAPCLHLTRLGCSHTKTNKRPGSVSVWRTCNTVGFGFLPTPSSGCMRVHTPPFPFNRGRCWVQIRPSHPEHYIGMMWVMGSRSYSWSLDLDTQTHSKTHSLSRTCTALLVFPWRSEIGELRGNDCADNRRGILEQKSSPPDCRNSSFPTLTLASADRLSQIL